MLTKIFGRVRGGDISCFPMTAATIVPENWPTQITATSSRIRSRRGKKKKKKSQQAAVPGADLTTLTDLGDHQAASRTVDSGSVLLELHFRS